MYDWRPWIRNRLLAVSDITDLVGVDGVYGQLEETPEHKPFIVIRLGATTPEIVVASSQTAVLWFHDEGGYTRIQTLMNLARATLVGQVAEDDAIAADWTGDSPDLADDARGTLVRNSGYRLVGRR